MRQGTKYGPEYVSALMKQLENYQVVTLTDQNDTPGETCPLRHSLPGWWSKLELFAPHVKRPFLYIDLDSFVFGPVDELCGGNQFRMVRDFNNWLPANSSVMWVPENPPPVWNEFMASPKKHMGAAGARGDQFFLGEYAEALWEPVESGIVSYKRHGKEGRTGTIMQFHGHPKPHEVRGGWVKERWAIYSA